MNAILQKELKDYFTSLFTYIYFVVFYVVAGMFTYSSCVSHASTEFGVYVLSKCIFVVLFFVPLCTMRLFAQEKKERTDQLLYTSPVTNMSILVGKTLATVIVILTPVIASVLYLIWMAFCGTVSVGSACSIYLACIFTILCFLMIGIVISIISPNSIIAAVATYAVYVVILMLRVLESTIDSVSIQHYISDFSLYSRYNDMNSGVIRTRDLIYLISLMIFLFVMALILLEIRKKNVKSIPQIVIAVALMIIANVIGASTNAVYDLTAEKVITLSSETEEAISHISAPTKIIYLGRESRADITYKELLSRYEQLNDNIEVMYEEMTDDSVIRLNYLSDFSSIHEASLLVISEKKQIFLDSADYLTQLVTTQYSSKMILNLENMLTSAIYYVNSEDEDGILMFNGSDELPIPSSFENALLLNEYKIKVVDLEAQANAIQNIFMDDYKIAFVNSPGEDYSEAEINQLEWFMEHGGDVVVALDPVNEDTPNIFSFLSKYGFEVQSGIVYEGNEIYCENETPYYIIPHVNKSNFTEGLYSNNMQPLSMTSKGIRCIKTENGYTTSEVLVTSDSAYSKLSNFDSAEKDEENDINGPFALAAVSEKEGMGSLFVITTNIMLNEDVDAQCYGANRKFFVDVMNTLVDKESGIFIPKKEVRTQVANYPLVSKGLIKIVMIVVIPGLLLALGIAVVVIRHTNLLVRKNIGGNTNEVNKKE